jgi:hypothetical protein
VRATFGAEAKAQLTAMTPLGVPWIEREPIAFLASDDAYIVSAAIYDVIVGNSANYNG